MSPQPSIPVWLRLPRATLWLVVAVLLLAAIGWVSPIQLPVVLYKASLIALAVVLGYWLDRGLFPYARPDGYLHRDWRCQGREPVPEGEVDFPIAAGYEFEFIAATLRRAIIVGAAVLGVAMGL